MTPGDRYRKRAAELKAEAATESEWRVKSELEALARSYCRLADQADRNSIRTISYETPERPMTTGRRQTSRSGAHKRSPPHFGSGAQGSR